MNEIFKTLVEFPTITGQFDVNHKALAYISDYLRARGMHIEQFKWNGYESMVATITPTITPKVLFVLHLDVVAAPDELFTLREDDEKFYGRGVLDMKFAIANVMQLVDDLKDDLQSYDFGIAITTDEEPGGWNGAAKLVEHGYKPEICIVPDGGGNWDIETFAKGLWYSEVVATGKAGHGSRPWEADSASLRLIGFLNELKALFPEQKPDTNTLNVGVIEAGEALNQIPANARATLDIRYMSKESLAQLKPTIEALCEKHGVTQNTFGLSAPCVNKIDHPLIAPFVESIKKVTGHESREITSFGGTDARFFADIDVPSIVAYPPGGNIHSDDEWIEKKGFYQYKEVLRDYLDKIAHLERS